MMPIGGFLVLRLSAIDSLADCLGGRAARKHTQRGYQPFYLCLPKEALM
jgi:hypothetical protein